MALAGSPLFQPDDQEDNDFFEQLACDLGDKDHLNLQQNVTGLNDAFSRLRMGGTGSDVTGASSSSPQEISGSDPAGDDSWLDDPLDEPFPSSGGVNESDLIACEGTTGSMSDHAPPSLDESFSGAINAEEVGMDAEDTQIHGDVKSGKLSPLDTFDVGAPMDNKQDLIVHQHVSSGVDLVGFEQHEISSFSVPPPEGPGCDISEEISKVNVPGASDVNAFKAVPEHVDTQGSQGLCSAESLLVVKGQQPLTNVKELQWSSFSKVFTDIDEQEPFSDFVSDLGAEAEAMTPFGREHDGNQFDASIAPQVAHDLQPVSSFGAELCAEQTDFFSSFNYNGKEAQQESDFPYAYQEDQRVHTYGTLEGQGNFGQVSTQVVKEQQVPYPVESGFPDHSNRDEGQAHADYAVSNGFNESHYQEALQQSWEYPGWLWDQTKNEWKQIEGWGAGAQLSGVDHGVFKSADGVNTNFATSTALEGALYDRPTSIGANLRGETTQGQVALANSVVPGSFQGVNSFGNESQVMPNTVTDSGPQPQVYWSEEYPGWYYDFHTQEWRPVDSSSQVIESSQPILEHSVGSSLIPQKGWVEEQSQLEYQHSLNQSVYWPGKSESLVHGGNEPAVSRNMSFSSLVQPSASENQQNMGNTYIVEGAYNGHRVDSWNGFPGYMNNSYPQQVLETNSALVEGSRSSDGRPAHALVAFGFGGKLITIKAMASAPGPIVVHDLNQLICMNQTGRNQGTSHFSVLNRPGLAGPLVGGGGVANKELFKWVDERVGNCEWEDPYCTSPEALRLLWGVLRIACLHYGKLRSMGTSSGLKSQAEDGPEVALGRLFAAAKSSRSLSNVSTLDALISVPTEHQLQAIASEIKRNLMEGKRKEALQLAQQGQLWGPALVLAWQIGEKVYAETVSQMAQQQFVPGSPLRTLFLLFAGQATELFTSQSLPSQAAGRNPGLTGSFKGAKDGAGGMLEDWVENLSIIAANPTKGDEQVIAHLGDSLWKEHGEVAAAHTCYLVAEANFESYSNNARLCLIGADHFKYQRTFASPQAIQRTELYEYAKVLGNPQYILVPFQPFKLLYAYMLTEVGKTAEARRYCQAVTKTLRNAGRAPEIEACRQAASALDDRLRLHLQGGYNFNAVPGKLVKNIFGSIDRSIHRMIGGPPAVPQPSETSQLTNSTNNTRGWYAGDQGGSLNIGTKMNFLGPSASNSSLVNAINQAEVPARSVSEPDLSKSPPQDLQSPANSELQSAPPKQSKIESSSGRYLGLFGTGILAKAVGLMKPNKREAKLGDKNKFYYDEKLKRWVEEGVEQTMEETTLAPPPITANFGTSFGSPATDAMTGTKSLSQVPREGASPSLSADMPPIPPSVNQFSARGRLQGVRSRYVDTFNKGGEATLSKSMQPSLVPTAALSTNSTPAQFFMPSLASTPNNDLREGSDNGHGNGELSSGGLNSAMNGQPQIENEPLMPKNLSSTFMATPPAIPRHSSASNVALYTNNEVVRRAGTSAVAPNSTNMSRAVSWSGDASALPNHEATNGAPSSSHSSPAHQLFWPNGSGVEPGNGFSSMKTRILGNPTSSSVSTLPSPPVIEPPMSYIGVDHSLLPAAKGKVFAGTPHAVQGIIYGDMQEVEL